MCNRNLHDCTLVSISTPLRLDIFATEKCVNHGGEYGLEFPSNFHFYGPEKATLNWLKNKIKKIEENLNENVKHYLK